MTETFFYQLTYIEIYFKTIDYFHFIEQQGQATRKTIIEQTVL